MKHFSDQDSYAVIGIGYFGGSLAKTLAKNGKSVIALDCDMSHLSNVAAAVSAVYQIPSITRENLEEAGVGNVGTAVIAIGENLEASILATLHCLEMEVPRVISKAGSYEHGRILEKMGAEVIFPEEDAGVRLATTLMSRSNLDTLPLSSDFSIASLDMNPKFAGNTVISLDWRRKYGVNIIAIIRDGKASAVITPETVLMEGDRIVLSGDNKSLAAFQSVNDKGLS